MIRSFGGPFLATFAVMVFFLLMQFLWMYVDDLVGKGVEWYYIAELLFYTAAGVVPLALPISVLLSSLMTFGNLGEFNELGAMKSAGVSLFRIMRPLIVLVLGLCTVAFLFSNYVLPVANLRGETLLRNIATKNPALNIREGVFYGGIEGYSMKIGEKYGPDDRLIRNIYIYDHSSRSGAGKLIVAEEGRMDISADERYLTLFLQRGTTYEDLIPSKRTERHRHPFARSRFDEAEIRFDLSSFQSGDLRENDQKSFNMMNVVQLSESVDSMGISLRARQIQMEQTLMNKYRVDEAKAGFDLDHTAGIPLEPGSDLLVRLPDAMRRRAIDNATRLARSQKAYVSQLAEEYDWRRKVIARFELERHKKFSLSFAVLVLFFIGAPLGAIIRKGGMGLPVVVSVLIFIVYHTMSYSMEKLGRELVWTPFRAMWTSGFILLPIGIFLTYKSATDSALFSVRSYTAPFRAIARLFKRPAAE